MWVHCPQSDKIMSYIYIYHDMSCQVSWSSLRQYEGNSNCEESYAGSYRAEALMVKWMMKKLYNKQYIYIIKYTKLLSYS